MNTTWFLGGNTAAGFHSCFGALLTDPAVRQTIILKGGAGCGKSTFMKKLRRQAHRLGANTASFPCASDPQSLDGLLIVPLGLAIVDGTAPHVLEPGLCCCDAVYLNLGAFYNTKDIQPHAETLRALRAQNQACYPIAYAHLRAAGEMQQIMLRSLTESQSHRLAAMARAAAQSFCQSGSGTGRVRRCFLRSFTPDGLLDHTESLACCTTRIALRDRFGLSGPFLRQILETVIAAGYDCIACDSPLSPGVLPDALLIPELSLALYTAPESTSLPADAELDLEQCCDAETLQPLIELQLRHQELAVAALSQARQIHDQMEAIYHPHVDFNGLDLLTQGYLQQLEQQLGV